MRRSINYLLIVILLNFSAVIWAQDPIMYWDFEKNGKGTSIPMSQTMTITPVKSCL